MLLPHSTAITAQDLIGNSIDDMIGDFQIRKFHD